MRADYGPNFCICEHAKAAFYHIEFVETYKTLDPAIKSYGEWNVDYVRKHQAGGEVVVSYSNTGDYAEVVFNGTCIYMQGNLHFNYGMIEIYVDDEFVQRRDMFIERQ